MKLQTWGWKTWDEAKSIVGSDAVGLWLGPAQVHCEILPDKAPDTDRVHAWSDTALWRLRVDGDRVLVTALAEEVRDGARVRETHVSESLVTVWSEGYVGKVDCPEKWTAFDVPGVSQLRFLRPA